MFRFSGKLLFLAMYRYDLPPKLVFYHELYPSNQSNQICINNVKIKMIYLFIYNSQDKTNATFFYPTLKVEENKVVLFFYIRLIFKKLWPFSEFHLNLKIIVKFKIWIQEVEQFVSDFFSISSYFSYQSCYICVYFLDI